MLNCARATIRSQSPLYYSFLKSENIITLKTPLKRWAEMSVAQSKPAIACMKDERLKLGFFFFYTHKMLCQAKMHQLSLS